MTKFPIKKDCKYYLKSHSFCAVFVRKLDGKSRMTSCDGCEETK